MIISHKNSTEQRKNNLEGNIGTKLMHEINIKMLVINFRNWKLKLYKWFNMCEKIVKICSKFFVIMN